MGFRDWFFRLKEKVKHRLTGSKSKPSETGANIGGERVDSTGSRPGSGPHIVAGGGHNQEGKRRNTNGGRVLSTVRLLRPDKPGSVPARGSKRRRADADGKEVEQTYSHLHSVDVEVAEGSGPTERKDIDGEKIERTYSSAFTTLIPRDGGPDGA